jgi:hypothetical protein
MEQRTYKSCWNGSVLGVCIEASPPYLPRIGGVSVSKSS